MVFKKGNILNEKTEAIVNTVNCVGVMGKGIALQFKQAYPENFKVYKKACDNKDVKPGKVHIFNLNRMFNPKYIINFPTKRHWKQKSIINDIEAGLSDLVKVIEELKIKSIAIPPLGCGNGGLDWITVKEMIIKHLEKSKGVEVFIYKPVGTPENTAMPVNTDKPKMTTARALYILLIEKYTETDYLLSQLEIQKLAYFLQSSGENLKLNFIAHKYGPYADNLNHVLQVMEGHFIRGYGDRSAGQVTKKSIQVLPEAVNAAKTFIENNNEALDRLKKVASLIFGFETPYGLELLSTTHWVIVNNPGITDNHSNIISKVQEWNTRKKNLFKPEHIKKAINKLQTAQWI